MRKLVIWALLAITAVAAPAFADAPEDAAQALVRETTEQVLQRLREDGATLEHDPRRLSDLVYQMILPHFDFMRMSQRVLGKHWRDASDDQRARFAHEFEAMLVRTYATALLQYRDNSIEFLSPRAQGPSQVSVRTQVVTAAGPPIPINYELYGKDRQWKVFDVAIDGVSLVINYRASFSGEIGKVGIDGLIEQLSKINNDKAAGNG